MTAPASARKLSIRAVSLLAIVFGLATIKEGGSVLLDLGTARAAAGHYVPFVLWFNSLAGFAYVLAGIGLWLQRRWATSLAIAIAAATVLASLALGIAILAGTPFERRTAFAMVLRSAVWIAIAGFAWRRTRQQGT